MEGRRRRGEGKRRKNERRGGILGDVGSGNPGRRPRVPASDDNVGYAFVSDVTYGHYFEYVEEETDYFSASRECYDKGGSLGVPVNEEEQQYLQDNMK